MTSESFIGQFGTRIRILAFFIAAVLVAGAFMAVTQQRPARSIAQPHYLGARQLLLDALSAKAQLFLRIPPITPSKGSHKTDIPLTSLGLGVTGGTQSAAPTFSSLTITKEVDAASPLLFQAAFTGNSVKQARVYILPSGKSSAFIWFDLAGVVVSSDHLNAAAHGSPTETVTLNFTHAVETYVQNGKVVSQSTALG